MADYKHGDMDIKTQEKTFDGFIGATKLVVGVSIGILVFLALFNS